MATLSSVVVDFIANTAKYTAGLETMGKAHKNWANNVGKDNKGVADTFGGVSKALDEFGKKIVSLYAIEKVGAMFVDAAKSVSTLVDEAEKVGASAEQFAILELAAKRNGATLQDVKTSYKELQKSINEGLNGVENTARAFLDLNESFTDLSKQKPDEAVMRVYDALSKVTDANKRAEIGTILLGKSYVELSSTISKGRAGIMAQGQGALGGIDLATIDKTKKAFEEVAIVIDTQIKQALVEMAPLLNKIAEISIVIIQNFKAVATTIAIAFSSYWVNKLIDILNSLAFKLFETGSNLIRMGKALKDVEMIAEGRAWIKLVEIFNKITVSLGTLSAVLLPVTLGVYAFLEGLIGGLEIVEKVGNFLGAGAYAQDAKELRLALEDRINSLLGFKTASQEEAEITAENVKKINAARQAKIDLLKKESKAEQDKIRDTALMNFRQSLEDITKMPDLPAKYNALIEFQSKFNDQIKDAPELLKLLKNAMRDLDNELEKNGEAIKRNLNAGYARMKQYEDIDLLVRTKKLTPEQGFLQKELINLEAFAKYDEQIAIIAQAKRIKADTLMGDREQAQALSTLGNSYREMIDPMYVYQKELIKINTLESQNIKGLTEAEAAMARRKLSVDLRGKQAGLIGKTDVQAMAEYQKKLLDIDMYLPASDVSKAQDRLAALQLAAEEFYKNAHPLLTGVFQNFGESIAKNFADAINGAKSFGAAMKDILKDVANDILNVILRQLLLKSLFNAIGTPLFGIANMGQLMYGGPRAGGGDVNAGTAYTVGENGPETFVPKSAGYIVPNGMRGNGSNVTVVQNISVETGVSQTVRAEMAALLPKFRSEAMAGVLDAKSRGGSYGRAFA